MAACSQCGKPAVVMVGEGLPLCVDCNLKLAQAQEIRDRALKEEANYLVDQMEAVSGISGVLPRYKIRTPVVHQGPMNFHNINVDRSVVGAINTGNVEKMEVALNEIHAHNTNPELEDSLKQFTETVLKDASLSAQNKDEIVEQLTALAAEAAKPKESRSAGAVRAVLTSVATSIPAALIEHWDKIKVLLGF
jgi:hypothetical protein